MPPRKLSSCVRPMNRLRSTSFQSRVLFCVALWCIFTMSAALVFAASGQSLADRKTVARNFDLLPLSFQPNQGQSSSDAKFLAQGRGFSALFKGTEADFLLAHSTGTSGLLRVTLPNSSRDVSISAESRLPGTVNYFNGNDPEKWHTGLPTFGRLRYANVYPGINLIYYGKQGTLEFDFQLSPEANPQSIQMRLQGAKILKLGDHGSLIVTVNGSVIRFQKPVIYQQTADNAKHLVPGSFRLLGKDRIGFAVAAYDRTRTLIIDPILNYSTYIGPYASATAIAVDSNGEAYITGGTGANFPTTQGSYQSASGSSAHNYLGPSWPFVAKFNSTGTALLYATYLTGNALDSAYGLALDTKGDAFVVGNTSSMNFPVTAGALQTTYNATKSTGFITELNSTGTALVYSTFLGGSTSSTVNGVAIDASGDAYLTGSTQDTNFPTTTGAYKTVALTKASSGLSSAFVAKLNPAGTALVYSTYLGGSQTDASSAIAIDTTGEAFVGGDTTSNDFPVTPGAIKPTREASNVQAAFVTKLNAAGSALMYSTYLSGSANDALYALALDSSGNLYAAGSTTSPDFPITSGAFQPKIGITYFNYPQGNAFVTELNSSATTLLYSTFLGGNISLGPYADDGDGATGIAVDRQGMVYVTGTACTGDFPVTAGAFEPQNLDGQITGECTAFITKLNPEPNTPLLYSTFLGGTGNGDADDYFYGEGANGLTLDLSNNVYLAGYTVSIDFPVTPGVVETAFTGSSEEAFVTEFNGSEMTSLPIPTVTLISNKSSALFGQPITFTATVQPASGNNPPTGYIGFNFFQLEPSDDEGLGVGFGPWTTVALNRSGIATFTTSSLHALQTPVNAFYLGDANNAPATGTMTQTLTYIPTTTTVTSSANNVPYGTPVVFTATVLDNTGKPAEGSVFFQLGSLAYAEPGLDSNGQATWTNGTGGSPLSVGTDTVGVRYFPVFGYQASTGTVAETFTPLGTSPAPTFTPLAGTYTSAQQVVLGDSSSTAQVYYTTDGSTPTPGVSPSLPAGFGITVLVNASETINALAVVPGYSPSNVVSAAYNFVKDFNLYLPIQLITLNPGQSGTLPLSINSLYGFNGVVSLACSGLPAGAACTFTPASITGSGNSTLTITPSATTGKNRPPANAPSVPFTILAAAFGCICIRQRKFSLLILLVCALPLCVLNGCGAGGVNSGTSSKSGTPAFPVSTTVTVTGTSGSLSHSATFTLTLDN